MRPFWVSWYHKPEPLELHSPWWVSGYRMEEVHGDYVETPTICAALMARDEDHARSQVLAAYLVAPAGEIEFRFVNERPADWSPFCDRFERADWMRWPVPTSSDPGDGAERVHEGPASTELGKPKT